MNKIFKTLGLLLLVMLAALSFSCVSGGEETASDDMAVEETTEAPAADDNNLLFMAGTTILPYELSPFNPNDDPSLPSPSEIVTVTDADGNEVQAVKFMPSVNNAGNALEYRVQLKFDNPIRTFTKSKVIIEYTSADEIFAGEPFHIVSFFTQKSGGAEGEVDKSILAAGAASPATLDFVANESGWTKPALVDSSNMCVGLELFYEASKDVTVDPSTFDGLTITSIRFE